MNGANVLPFPDLGAAAASRSSSLAAPRGGTSARSTSADLGFADAMQGALGSDAATLRHADPAPRPRGPRMQSLSTAPAKPKGPVRPGPSSRVSTGARDHRSPDAASVAAPRGGRVAENARDVESRSAAKDRECGDSTAPVPAATDDVAVAAAPRAGDADADDPSGATPGETDGDPGSNGHVAANTSSDTGDAVAAAPVAADASAPTPGGAPGTAARADETSPDGVPQGGASGARILQWVGADPRDVTTSEAGEAQAAQAETDADVSGDAPEDASTSSSPGAPETGALAAPPAQGRGGRLQFQNPAATDARSHGASQAAGTAGEHAAASTEAAATTAPTFAAALPEGATPQGSKAAEHATALTDATAQAAPETEVTGVEQSGSDTAGFDGRERDQPRTAAVTRPAQVIAPAASASAGDPVRFAVNVSAGTAAYSTAAAPEAGMLPQIVQSIRIHALQGASEARVQLRPDHLGALNITLKVDQGQVTATIHAEVAAVRGWIQSHESSLRQALSEQGLQLARLIVQEDGQAPSGDEAQPQDTPRRQPRRQSWKEESATFEVLV